MMHRHDYLLHCLLAVLTAIPPSLLAITIARCYVDIPYWDQWNFVGLVGDSYEGRVTLEALWQPHNEHRILLPRLLMLALAHLSHYNLGVEVAASFVIATGSFVLIALQARRSLRISGIEGSPWILPVVSLLVFSLAQGENWICGWQMQIFMNVLFVIAGLTLLARSPLSTPRLLAAALFGLMATLSFGTGLIYWPVGLAAILLDTGNERRPKQVALWTLLSAVTYASYFYKLTGTDSVLLLSMPFHDPLSYLVYVLKYLGAPVTNYEGPAVVVGAVGLALFAGTALYVIRVMRVGTPFLLLGLYSLASGMFIGLGRMEKGSVQAMSNRYVTISLLLWVSSLVLLFMCSAARKRPTSGRFTALARGAATVAVLAVCFSIARTSYRVGASVLTSYHDKLAPVRAAILEGNESAELLKQLYPHPDYVRKGLAILKKHKLSVYRGI